MQELSVEGFRHMFGVRFSLVETKLYYYAKPWEFGEFSKNCINIIWNIEKISEKSEIFTKIFVFLCALLGKIRIIINIGYNGGWGGG